MEQTLIKIFRQIRTDCPRKCKELKARCEELLVALAEKKPGQAPGAERDADPYFAHLRFACESGQSKVVEAALDGMHSLIEHGYLRGSKQISQLAEGSAASALSAVDGADEASDSPMQPRILMDSIIETVSRCADENDDDVHLQVIKVLLTAVTSPYCEVHEASLLLAVRTCFHIHMMSRNQSNKTSVKAALTQMLSVVNVKMEVFDGRADPSLGIQSSESKDTLDTFGCSSSSQDIANNLGSKSDTLENDGDGVAVEAATEGAESLETQEGNGSSAKVRFLSLMHKDSFLLFRALCVISMKANQDEGSSSSSQADAIALPNKLLSLELILHILQRSGPAFRTDGSFLFVIKNYLCVSLLRNCTSHVASVIGLSLQIFVSLMEGFKNHLKSELEVFVTNVFLRILESENSTYDHKLRVLEVFHTICRDPKALVELFINYDCDLDAIDLFRRIVDGFAKVAKNPSLSQSRTTVDFMSSSGKKAMAEEHHLRMMGLEGLVIILRALLKSSGLGMGLLDDGVAESAPGAASAAGGGALRSGSSYGSFVSPIKPQETAEDDGFSLDNAGAVVDNIPVNAVDTFDRKQRMQEEIETGILKFNLSSKKGLAYLAAKGHIEMTPKSVSDFFHQYHEKLDKTILGDYLGREREYENGFCLKVLHEYVDAMDFANKPFDLAIRHFLSGFRLPGEAQKIDRLMEKFAERYYLQNKEVFASADMAFILAFSTIMLQTNLHNPAIRDRRMTKEQFVKQNKGISPDGELPDDLLMEIYDRIAAQPISMTQDDKILKKMKKDEESSFVVFQTSVDKRRKDAFNDERMEMVRAGEAMFKQKTKAGKAFVRHSTRSSDDAYIRPMFEVTWAPAIGVLSQILETYEDPSMVDLCLFGFQYAIRLACRLEFPVGRSTYINALATFTALDQVREMRPKNVESIKVLIGIALSEGDFLEESWCQVLLCISQLARLQLFGNGLHTDDLFFKDSSTGDKGSSGRKNSGSTFASRSPHGEKGTGMSDPFTKLFSGPSRAETARLVEEANAIMVIREISPVAIDRIFINSSKLSGESVQHFVRSLCEVSLLEISASRITTNIRAKDSAGDSFSPRIFSLQKLVEVADFNMHIRSRIAWTNIWSLLARHFTSVAMYDNHPLAMYAIDSLKQLSIKFLQKEELSNFNFQRVFLKPFEEVISRAKSPEIKDLILRCIDIMILACAGNIRSGWRSIFAIFEAAAAQEKVEIATLGFEIIERLMLNQFNLLIFDFVELINCLVTFVACSHTTLSLRALRHLAQCADYLGEGEVTAALNLLQTTAAAAENFSPVDGKPAANSIDVAEDGGGVFRLWWPLLFGLSRIVGDGRLQVRLGALETLNHILRKSGHLFAPQAWAVIFRGVLFPMIDSAKRDFTRQPLSSWPSENPPISSDRHSWIGTMAVAVLDTCVGLYLEFRGNSDAAQLLPEILCLLEDCVCQEVESLARIGLLVFNMLAQSMCSLPRGEEAQSPSAPVLDDLICDRLCACLGSNLCLDFGEAGSVRLSRESPAEILDQMKVCPLTARRSARESDFSDEQDLASLDQIVVTPYGQGRVVEIVTSTLGLNLLPRKCVNLGWGFLYTQERFATPAPAWEAPSEALGTVKTEAQDWAHLASAAMTSMVITLDFLRVLQDFYDKGGPNFHAHHHVSLMSILESTHWHARSFNEDQVLRSALRARSFMKFPDSPGRLPNLLEQEVRSATLLVQIAVKIFVSGDSTLAAISEPFVKRYVATVCNRFMDLDDTLDTPSPVSTDLVAAYKPAVLSGITGLCDLSMQTFRSCVSWLGPLITRLITCHDREVRGALQVLVARLVFPSME